MPQPGGFKPFRGGSVYSNQPTYDYTPNQPGPYTGGFKPFRGGSVYSDPYVRKPKPYTSTY
jgi:hypothetical protein